MSPGSSPLEQVKALRHVERHRVIVHRGRLAGDLRCSIRTVGRIRAELERQGFLERVRRRGHDGVVVEYVGPPRAIPVNRQAAHRAPGQHPLICSTVGDVGRLGGDDHGE